MRPLLLLVDLQDDFLAAAGLEPAAGEIVDGASRLLAGARHRGLPVVHVWTTVERSDDRRMPHWRFRDRWMCVRGTPGHATPAPLAPQAGEAVVHKTDFSAFSTGELTSVLESRGADALWIAGVHLHGCVRATALDAYARRLDVSIAEDAVGSDDPLHAAATARYLEDRAIRFASGEDLLAGDATPAPQALALQAGVAAPDASAFAAKAGRAAQRDWEAAEVRERVRPILRLADLLEARADALARMMAEDVAKPIRLGLAEALRAAELLRRASELALESDDAAAGPASRARRRPLGVVAIVTPWNNPLAIPAGKLGPALALGNAVVWKPAPAATRAARELSLLAREAGLPAGVLQIVEGGRRAAAQLMRAAEVDGVSLSGSSRAGWAAQEICSSRRIPLQAELGGNNAAIVWTGADVSLASRLVAEGAFAFAGQRCTANRRAIVDARLSDRFVEEVTAATEGLACGDPLDARTLVGPLVSVRDRRRIEALLERARDAGARIVSLRQAAPAAAFPPSEAFHPPTIVLDAAPGSEIAAEESFGPILVVLRAATFSDALALAGGVRQGLAAALFGGSADERRRFLDETRSGILKLDLSTADADPAAPFGGWKASGLGPAEHGRSAGEFFTRAQAVYDEG